MPSANRLVNASHRGLRIGGCALLSVCASLSSGHGGSFARHQDRARASAASLPPIEWLTDSVGRLAATWAAGDVPEALHGLPGPVRFSESVGTIDGASDAVQTTVSQQPLHAVPATRRWRFLGPLPIGSGANAASGRLEAIAFHLHDPNTIYIGAAGGGVWKTTDRGVHWTSLTGGQR